MSLLSSLPCDVYVYAYVTSEFRDSPMLIKKNKKRFGTGQCTRPSDNVIDYNCTYALIYKCLLIVELKQSLTFL